MAKKDQTLPLKHKQMLMTRRNRIGYVFIAPFLVGFVLFILIPLIQSLNFSFNDIQIGRTPGKVYDLIPKGLDNYNQILFVQTSFRQRIVESFRMTFSDTLIVVPFSFFSAIILSKPFKGRTLARAIFFLPVIVSTGMLAGTTNSVMAMMMSRDAASSINSMDASESALQFINSLFAESLPQEIVNYVAKATDNLYDVIIKSGLQIIIFLGGLNTISPSIYESSNIEGATAWVNFWKITFPMCGPYLLLNVVYTIIDSFTNQDNPLIRHIWTQMTGMKDFGIASAEAWIYFVGMGLVLGVVFYIMSRRVYYRE